MINPSKKQKLVDFIWSPKAVLHRGMFPLKEPALMVLHSPKIQSASDIP